MNQGIPLLPDFMARIIEKWASKRLPETKNNITLVRQRIYILPTRHGIGFLIILMFILAGSINYENSAGYMLTFLLTAIGFLGMIHTHQNLNHLKLNSMTTKPVFAGQVARFNVQLSGKNNKEHFNIKFQTVNSDAVSATLSNDQPGSVIEIPQLTKKRGVCKLGRIKTFTEFPLGLFHAWSWIELDAQCLVYPAPEAHPPEYNTSNLKASGKPGQLTGNDDFAGIREYQKGDSSSMLAWKAIARSGKLQSKLFYSESGNEIWLRWDDFPVNMHTEQRLSILCRWIIECHKKGIIYGLDIPDKKILPASGLLHQNSSLRALALYGLNQT